MTTFSRPIDVCHFRLYGDIHTEKKWNDRCRHQIGKWIVSLSGQNIWPILDKTTALCVVDDFGDLVAVQQ